MKHFPLRRGHDLPIEGTPSASVQAAPDAKSIAILGDDYVGLKPRILVAENDVVGIGTPILINKALPEVQIVSPVAGKVKAIHRGARRALR